MWGDRKERWVELSECASKEQDPQKLTELLAEIDRMLQEKQDRLIRGIPLLQRTPSESRLHPY